MKRTLLALIIVISIASTLVGGTLAGFSDTERSLDNEVDVADMDIKVAMADSFWTAGDYHDDPDLEPVMEEECALICQTYGANIYLKNQGRVNGTAALHIRITEDSAGIADTTTVKIYYDTNGDGDADEQITTDPTYLQSLDCNPVTLGALDGCGAPRKLILEVHPQAPGDEAVAGFTLGFDVEFQLIQVGCPGFTDTEVSWAYLEGCGEGCTPGGWKKRLLDIGEWDNTVSLYGPPYSPYQSVVSVFGAAGFYSPEIAYATLLVAISPELWGPGDTDLEGKVKTLLKHAVAAVLNAAHPGVGYPMSQDDIIIDVNAALASGSEVIIDDLKDILAGYNELGCPITGGN